MWQRFTERARRVILLGQEEAGKMNSGYVGTEHLLLGLVRENEGVAAQVLSKMGASLAKVRTEIEGEVPVVSDPTFGEPKLTPKAKRVLELAADEARRMRHNYIGTEHLLLALLREKDGLAAVVLRRLGLNLEKARAQVLEYLGPDNSELIPSTPFEEERRHPAGSMGWTSYAERARRAILRAQDEAARLQSSYVGSEHLLIGLLLESDGVAARALSHLGVELTNVRPIVEANSEAAPLSFKAPKLTTEAKRILELAVVEARRFRRNTIGTEHLLLALMNEENGAGATILRQLGVDLHEARTIVFDFAGPREDPLEVAREQQPPATMRDQEAKPKLWKRLDDDAKRALQFAQQEAALRRYASVGSEHVLLGLISVGESTAAQLLHARGIFLPTLRAHIKVRVPDGSDVVADEATFDDKTIELLSHAADEAKSMGRTAIGTEHLLLALLSDKNSIAAQIVAQLADEASDLEARLNARLAPATEFAQVSPKFALSSQTINVLELAAAQAHRLGEPEITPEILFAALLNVADDKMEAILKQAKKNNEAGKNAA